MNSSFKYDVFLSYSSKDSVLAREVAERLRADGIKVWLDIWEIKHGDLPASKIEEGLENSRVLVLCISKNTFGSEWIQLEAGTFRFRDPVNKERRFIPLRLDKSEMQGSLTQFLYINWHGKKLEYSKLLAACRPDKIQPLFAAKIISKQTTLNKFQLGSKRGLRTCEICDNWKYALTGYRDASIVVWNIQKGIAEKIFTGHGDEVNCVAWSNDREYILSCSNDNTIRLWKGNSGKCISVFYGHSNGVSCVSWSPDQRLALSSSMDCTVRLWDIKTGECVRVFTGHKLGVTNVVWSNNQKQFASCSNDRTVRLWDVETGVCKLVFEGHTEFVGYAIWSTDNRKIITGSGDRTIRIWDITNGQCLSKYAGHDDKILSLSLNGNQNYVLSGSGDSSASLWDIYTGRRLCMLADFKSAIVKVEWNKNNRHAITVNSEGNVIVWDLSEFVTEEKSRKNDTKDNLNHVQYTNAKVLLVGESSSGKTGLSKRLALGKWEPSDSTVGAWATQWKLPVKQGNDIEREIWLWDFGGQSDQRLIHQLYMDETALAVLVFDGQKEDMFETLGQWDRDISRASAKAFAKLLVVGRVDAGGLRYGRVQVEKFGKERGFTQLLETSAKTGLGCEELKNAIVEGIKWADIPWRSSPVLFRILKEQIIRLKDEGRVLVAFKELREYLNLRLIELEGGSIKRFTDEELRAVISLLSGPGIVWELGFGSWILLQPERINAYAQAVIQTIREDKYELGCLSESRVLNGELTYMSSIQRLHGDEEKFILLAMHQMLVERGICLREHTDNGTLLIFPSYYRRERPELMGHPAILLSYRFNGFIDDVYATLVVRLNHTKPFDLDELWRYAADFRTLTNKQLGIKMTRRFEGAGEIEVYFDASIPIEEKIIFSKYVHEHIRRNAEDVVRLRHYVCPVCSRPIADREVAMEKLAEGKRDIVCVKCENRVPLWDDLEQYFASKDMQQKVIELEQQSQIVLDNESKERILVGEVISTIATAGQIYREFSVSDHGIDMEIEFKSELGKATGKKLYLQLKSGDSHLRVRKSDGAEVFSFSTRHAEYWMAQAFPVLLVVRGSNGEIRWMEIRSKIIAQSENGTKDVRHIVFEGERFDVMSIRRWRERILIEKKS